MNLARAVKVSMDTAVQPCKDRKVIDPGHWVAVGRWSVLWDFGWFHGCFHGQLVVIQGLCLPGGV